ncbi:MAG: radical SAM protein [Asgard group archaeon]|nr:radical SAM protein [Asgard group archaeon]
MSKLVEAHIEEINAIKKDLSQMRLKIAFCYPNNYRAGMASLGLQLIYRLWNSYDGVACERTFLPLKKTVEPYTLESDRPLREMDVIAFTLQYEDDYTNVLEILERSNIPLKSNNRNNDHPLVIAGGPCVQSNPVPMSPFIDGFMVGDLEPVNEEFMEEGLLGNNNRNDRMEVLNEFEWMWIPEIEEDKTVVYAPKGNIDDYFYPIKQIIPQVEEEDPWYGVFGKSYMLEVVRGCNRGCSFCLTGKINRPKRDRSLEKLTELYRAGTTECNVNKITTIGSGISDYKDLENLCQNILDDNLTFSLPSIRADKITENLVKLLVNAKQRTITTAPEAGTEKLRKQICKGVNDEEIIQAVKTASDGGLSRVKAYFILGLPDETTEDIEAIAELAEQMAKAGKEIRKLRISCGFFVPKPRTSYQGKSLFSLKNLQAKSKLLKSRTKNLTKVDCEITNPKMSRIQTILSIGGKEISEPLRLAARLGGGLGDWRRALKEFGMSIEGIVENRVIDDIYPWEFIKLK